MKVEELNSKFLKVFEVSKELYDYEENSPTFDEKKWCGLANRANELEQDFKEYLKSNGFCEDFIDVMRNGLIYMFLHEED